MGIVTLIWMFGGFGLAFGKDIHGVIGRFTDYFGLAHVARHQRYGDHAKHQLEQEEQGKWDRSSMNCIWY